MVILVVKISVTKLDDFIIKGFRTIVFIFISSTFRSGVCRTREPIKYSCIVTRLQLGLNLQPPDDCLLRSLGNKRL